MTANYETTRQLTDRFYYLILNASCDVDLKSCCDEFHHEDMYNACDDDQIRAAFVRAAAKACGEYAANYYETEIDNRENMVSPADYVEWLTAVCSKVAETPIKRRLEPLAIMQPVNNGLGATIIWRREVADGREVVICSLIGGANQYVVWNAIGSQGAWTMHCGFYTDCLKTAVERAELRVGTESQFAGN